MRIYLVNCLQFLVENHSGMEIDNNNFCFQIKHLWGDPFYVNANKTYTLNKDTWEFAVSKSKSIGVLLKYYCKNTVSFICLTIYTSGKVICLNDNSISLNKMIPNIMTDKMIDKLTPDRIHNNGHLLNFDETLFLVERGSLLLFSWSDSIMEWIQTPIMYIYSLILNRPNISITLSEYLSYTFSRRSGYLLKNKSPTENAIIKNLEYKKNNNLSVKVVKINELHEVVDRQSKRKYPQPIEKTSYTIRTNNQDSTKNWISLLSKQPSESFYIERDISSKEHEILASVVSINSETKFKITFLKL